MLYDNGPRIPAVPNRMPYQPPQGLPQRPPGVADPFGGGDNYLKQRCAQLEGDIAFLTTGRLMFGYRTQKNPKAGAGGQDYGDLTYGAQLVRSIGESTRVGFAADRNLRLSAYEDNGFYVADTLRADMSTRLPWAFFVTGNVSQQSHKYKASPQFSGATGESVLRNDKLRSWSVGLTRSVTTWAFLRANYVVEKRNSNLARFAINTRSLTFELGIGFFGKQGRQAPAAW